MSAQLLLEHHYRTVYVRALFEHGHGMQHLRLLQLPRQVRLDELRSTIPLQHRKIRFNTASVILIELPDLTLMLNMTDNPGH